MYHIFQKSRCSIRKTKSLFITFEQYTIGTLEIAFYIKRKLELELENKIRI